MKRLMVLMFFLTGALFAQSPDALIKEITGTVELKKSGADAWVPAKPGDSVEKDTIVSTGFKSSALLVVGNSTLMVRPLTRLSLAALLVNQDNAETINVALSTGRIQVGVKPPAGGRTDFTVTTPIATASVRGTEFEMDAANLAVNEGKVSYASNDAQARPVTVSAGQTTWVDSGSNKAVNPFVAGEINRALPALPGRDASQGTERSSRLRVPQGTFVAEVTLNDGN